MIQHHLPDAWSAETAAAPYPVLSRRSATRWHTRHGPRPPCGQRTDRIPLPPAATPAPGSRPGSGSTDGSAPMSHADDDHGGHPMPQPAR
jgi:hypothetical protein